MNETTTPLAAAAEPAADAAPPVRGILSRVRAWFAAALATVKAAAAPQVQQGPDLVDTVPAAPGKFRLWLSAAWAAVKRGRVVVALLVIGALSLIAVQFLWPDPPPANPSAAVQTNPLAPLIARIAALEARVDALQTTAPTPPAARQRVQRAAPMAMQPEATPAPYSEPQPDPSTWGATDLDRAIDTFTPPTTFGARP